MIFCLGNDFIFGANIMELPNQENSRGHFRGCIIYSCLVYEFKSAYPDKELSLYSHHSTSSCTRIILVGNEYIIIIALYFLSLSFNSIKHNRAEICDEKCKTFLNIALV